MVTGFLLGGDRNVLKLGDRNVLKLGNREGRTNFVNMPLNYTLEKDDFFVWHMKYV